MAPVLIPHAGFQFEKSALQAAYRHAESTYPQECCGLFLENRSTRVIETFVACRNLQNALHAQDAQRYPRDATRAYSMDDREIAAIAQRHPDAVIRGIVHSHNDTGVYFSQEDLEMACPWGEPLFPEHFYWIWGVDRHKAVAGSLFFWDPQNSRYQESPFAIDRLS